MGKTRCNPSRLSRQLILADDLAEGRKISRKDHAVERSASSTVAASEQPMCPTGRPDSADLKGLALGKLSSFFFLVIFLFQVLLPRSFQASAGRSAEEATGICVCFFVS